MYGAAPFGSIAYGAVATEVDTTQILTESVVLASPVNDIVIQALLESLVVNQGVDEYLYALSLIEPLGITDTSLSAVLYLATLFESLEIAAAQNAILNGDVTENIETTGAATADVYRLIALVESIRLASDISVDITARIAEAVAILNVLSLVFSADITDAAAIEAGINAQINAYTLLIDALNVSGALDGIAVMTVLLEDDMLVDSQILTAATFFALVEDGLSVSITLSQDGVQYTARTLNATTKSVTEYANYPFNSFAYFNGVLYGALPDGLYALNADSDAGVPIDAYARTALARIARGAQAQVDSAYIGYSSDGRMQLKTIATEPSGTKTARIYELKAQNAAALRAGRIKLGRGVKSAYWAFEISNVAGSDFTIDVIEFHVLALSRRI